MNVFVFTPTPTHPAIQGNRRRVFDICRALQSVGAELTVLYYSTEGIDPAAARQMRETWGEFNVVFPRGFIQRHTLVQHHAIDDWYDDDISEAVENLCAKKSFDVCIVNYAWYSKLFEILPQSVVRVIDTHDIFGRRAESFRNIGLDPKWFHTSVEQEAIGLDRADLVIAIQDIEAIVLRGRTRAAVHSVGYLSPPDFLPPRPRVVTDRLVVGYIGSGNPFNVACMQSLAESVQRRPDILAKIDIRVAGPVCKALGSGSHPFTLCGVVDAVSDFYRSVDVVMNPMLGGTGLKIKSLEALGFGKPLVATSDAMIGIATDHPNHRLADISVLLDKLLLIADEPGTLIDEAVASRRVFHAYQNLQTQAFLFLWSEIVAAVDGRRRAHRSGPEK